MPDAPEALVLDLLESVATAPRSYAETQEAWRTSCPRLPVWEDALDAGYLRRDGARVALTEAGTRFLSASRPGVMP